MDYLTITEDIKSLLRLKDQMMQSLGLFISTLLTGILFALGTSSLFLLSSSREDENLLRRNRFLRVYIVVLLLAILVLDIEVFILVNEITIFKFFSQELNTYQNLQGIWTKLSGSTMLVIILLSDGVLVR